MDPDNIYLVRAVAHHWLPPTTGIDEAYSIEFQRLAKVYPDGDVDIFDRRELPFSVDLHINAGNRDQIFEALYRFTRKRSDNPVLEDQVIFLAQRDTNNIWRIVTDLHPEVSLDDAMLMVELFDSELNDMPMSAEAIAAERAAHDASIVDIVTPMRALLAAHDSRSNTA